MAFFRDLLIELFRVTQKRLFVFSANFQHETYYRTFIAKKYIFVLP